VRGLQLLPRGHELQLGALLALLPLHIQGRKLYIGERRKGYGVSYCRPNRVLGAEG
jgi:hypothetical protein